MVYKYVILIVVLVRNLCVYGGFIECGNGIEGGNSDI